MHKLAELLAMVHGLTEERMAAWIARGFVVPEEVHGERLFADIDVARVRLICELEDEMALDPDAVGLLLSLLDQVYTLRSQLRFMTDALAGQPAEVREAILMALGRNGDKGG